MSDPVLLKIKRQFSKDESMKYVLDLLKQKELEIGMLKSELAEARFVSESVPEVKPEGKTKKQWLKEEVLQQMENEIKGIRKRNKKLEEDLTLWRNKYFSLVAEKNKNETEKNKTMCKMSLEGVNRSQSDPGRLLPDQTSKS